MSYSIIIIINTINQITIFHTFFLVFYFFKFFQLDFLAAVTTFKVVMVHASPLFRCLLAKGGVPH
jgi:hypothetical protein